MLASCPPSVYEPVAITELSPNRQMDIPLGDVRIYNILIYHSTSVTLSQGGDQGPEVFTFRTTKKKIKATTTTTTTPRNSRLEENSGGRLNRLDTGTIISVLTVIIKRILS